MKNKYLQDIRDLQSITLTKICKENKINYANLYNGLASEKTTKLARDEFIKSLKEIIKRID